MAFIDEVKTLSKQFANRIKHLNTEEATKYGEPQSLDHKTGK